MSEELVALAKRLIGYETSEPQAISEAAGFVTGWLQERGIEAPWESRARVLVSISPRLEAEGLIRRGARMAAVMDASLTVLTVRTTLGTTGAGTSSVRAGASSTAAGSSGVAGGCSSALGAASSCLVGAACSAFVGGAFSCLGDAACSAC